MRIFTVILCSQLSIGWRRPIGCLKLQVIFRKRAIDCIKLQVIFHYITDLWEYLLAKSLTALSSTPRIALEVDGPFHFRWFIYTYICMYIQVCVFIYMCATPCSLSSFPPFLASAGGKPLFDDLLFARGTHTATHCNTLQHTAAHCNTLQHSATHTTSCFWKCRMWAKSKSSDSTF